MLEKFYEANAAFVARRRMVPPVPSGHGVQLAIVSCMDPRLVSLLPDALGVAPDEAYHIRNAGNTCTQWDESILRSVAVTVLARGVRHVAVVGHTDCRMAGDLMPILDEMRRGGVPRDAFGNRDPREWFGILAGIESNVRNVLEMLKRSPLLPAGVSLYGLIIDSESGELRALGSETTAGPALAAAAVASDRTPRQGDSLEHVLGVGILSSLVPKAGEVPVAGSPPTADAALTALTASTLVDVASPTAPPAPTVDRAAFFREQFAPPPLRDFAARSEPTPKPEPPKPPERPSPPPRANVRRDVERDRQREKDRVPLDPREAQEFFRKREQERLRKKRRDRGL